MNILYLHQYFVTPDENGSDRSYWIARQLVKAGHNVTMITSTHEHAKRKAGEYLIDDIKVIYLKNSYNNRMRAVRRMLSFLFFFIRSLVKCLYIKSVDLIIATSTPLSVGMVAWKVHYFRSVPYIFEVRDLWPEFPVQMKALKNKTAIMILRWFEKSIYKNAAHIITLSPGMVDGIVQAGTNLEKITMIPNMANIDFFRNRQKDKRTALQFQIDLNKFNIVYFGTLGISSGLGYIIEAAKLLQGKNRDDINFIIVGKGMLYQLLEEQISALGLTNVKLLGYKEPALVSEIVNCCDASIVTFMNLPVLRTNSPNKFFDSLAAAKPVIVNSDGWTRQLIEESQCGAYVDPDKPGELANLLEKWKQQPDLLSIMAKNARELAERRFDKSLLCEHFVEVVNRLKIT